DPRGVNERVAALHRDMDLHVRGGQVDRRAGPLLEVRPDLQIDIAAGKGQVLVRAPSAQRERGLRAKQMPRNLVHRLADRVEVVRGAGDLRKPRHAEHLAQPRLRLLDTLRLDVQQDLVALDLHPVARQAQRPLDILREFPLEIAPVLALQRDLCITNDNGLHHISRYHYLYGQCVPPGEVPRATDTKAHRWRAMLTTFTLNLIQSGPSRTLPPGLCPHRSWRTICRPSTSGSRMSTVIRPAGTPQRWGATLSPLRRRPPVPSRVWRPARRRRHSHPRRSGGRTRRRQARRRQ